MNQIKKTRVLFVCMGNICRSPTAEGVTRALAKAAGVDAWLTFDSAGTHDYHIGAAPDPRAQAAALRRGYDLSQLRARQVVKEDFVRFDLILAMDGHNLELLRQRCPPDQQHKLALFMKYALQPETDEVPDPYYGGPGGFDHVLNLVEDAARGLIKSLRNQ